MAKLGWILVLLGVLAMIVVPTGAIDLSGTTLLAIPGELSAIFIAVLGVAMGVFVLYLSWYRSYARSIDLNL